MKTPITLDLPQIAQLVSEALQARGIRADQSTFAVLPNSVVQESQNVPDGTWQDVVTAASAQVTVVADFNDPRTQASEPASLVAHNSMVEQLRRSVTFTDEQLAFIGSEVCDIEGPFDPNHPHVAPYLVGHLRFLEGQTEKLVVLCERLQTTPHGTVGEAVERIMEKASQHFGGSADQPEEVQHEGEAA